MQLQAGISGSSRHGGNGCEDDRASRASFARVSKLGDTEGALGEQEAVQAQVDADAAEQPVLMAVTASGSRIGVSSSFPFLLKHGIV